MCNDPLPSVRVLLPYARSKDRIPGESYSFAYALGGWEQKGLRPPKLDAELNPFAADNQDHAEVRVYDI